MFQGNPYGAQFGGSPMMSGGYSFAPQLPQGFGGMSSFGAQFGGGMPPIGGGYSFGGGGGGFPSFNPHGSGGGQNTGGGAYGGTGATNRPPGLTGSIVNPAMGAQPTIGGPGGSAGGPNTPPALRDGYGRARPENDPASQNPLGAARNPRRGSGMTGGFNPWMGSIDAQQMMGASPWTGFFNSMAPQFAGMNNARADNGAFEQGDSYWRIGNRNVNANNQIMNEGVSYAYDMYGRPRRLTIEEQRGRGSSRNADGSQRTLGSDGPFG